MRCWFAVMLVLAALPALGQEPLVVGTKIAAPFVMESESGGLTGISIDLWEELAADLDIAFEYRRSGLDELLEGVRQGSLDVAVGALSMTAAREQTIDFTHPFHVSALAVATRPQSAGWWRALQRFFSYQFLIAVLALFGLLVAVGLVVWLFERRTNAEEFGGPAPRGLANGLWWAAVTMTTVGYGDKSPRTLGGRIVGLVWMFTAVIVLSGFTAGIATSLTVGRLAGQIENLDDLRGLRVASVTRATSGEALTARGIGFTPVADVEAALAALAAGRVDAVVYDAAILLYLANNEYPKRTQVLALRFDPQEYGFALPDGSPLREALNRGILRITEQDEWQKLLDNYLGATR